MSDAREGCALDRRKLVIGAAGVVASAGLAGPLARPAHGARKGRKKDVQPAPNPIPGGFEIPPNTFHVFVPGDPAITLPFTGLTLEGFDAEPSTITDFKGSSAVAFLIGTAKGSDGVTYNLEADIRGFEGEYVVDGKTYEGSFAFVWIDLFDPGSGSQLHDFNGGILPSGLFWTTDVRRSDVSFRTNGRRATLEVEGLPVIDTFQIFGPNDTPALVDFRVDWFATRPFVPRGEGDTVPPTDKRAWLGETARAESIGSFSGEEIGFAFEAKDVSTSRGYAQLGTERNGVFL